MESIQESLVILGIALGWDLILAEPPRKFHPVVWMGKLIQIIGFRLEFSRLRPSIGSILIYASLIPIFVGIPWMVLSWMNTWILRLLLSSYLLKSCFAIKDLHLHLNPIRKALADRDLDRARYFVSKIVSRDTSNLSESQLISASIESISENLCDSVIAPLFYFWMLGIPGALGYRLVNTLDSMLGYPRFRLGRYVAKLDEMLNFLPSKISSGLILVSCMILRLDWRNGLRVLRLHRSRCPSSNAGWQLSLVAGSLNLELEKPGVYRIGIQNRQLELEDISMALRIWDLSWMVFVLISTWIGFSWTLAMLSHAS